MSFQAMAWAIKQNVENATAKFVLIMIANYADENGRAYPSIGRLASDTSTSESTVQRALAWLEQNGRLRREKRDGKQDVLHLIYPSQNEGGQEPTPVKMTGEGSQNDRGTPVKLTDEPIIKPIKNQSEISSGSPDKPSSTDEKKVLKFQYPGEFEMFWAEYPRHKGVSKLEAFKEWKKLSEAEQDEALEGAIAYAEQCRSEKKDESYIVHPCRFIKHRRFETLLEAAQ